MVRVRDSPTCAICEFVMKQLESMLEDHETEVGCVLTGCIWYDHKNNLYKTRRSSGVKLTHLSLSQEEVKHAVEKVCTFLPSSLTAQCKDLIESYGEAIIELLVQEADPKTVCVVLGLCNGANRAYVRKFSLFKEGNAQYFCFWKGKIWKKKNCPMWSSRIPESWNPICSILSVFSCCAMSTKQCTLTYVITLISVVIPFSCTWPDSL